VIGREKMTKLTLNNIGFQKVKDIKVRKITPMHALTKIQEDKTKQIPRKEKHKHINSYEV
jgi:hypothetical protein